MSEHQEDEKSQGSGTSFEQRLRAARERAKLDSSPARDQRDPLGGPAWAIAIRVGVELVAALLVGVGIGWLLDRWLHTRPVFLIVFVLLGGAAGIRNVYRVFSPKD